MGKVTRVLSGSSKSKTVKKKKQPKVVSQQAQPKSEKRKKGRPNGKKSDPEYQQVTTILHRENYQQARRILRKSKKSFGGLVDELVSAWLKSQV